MSPFILTVIYCVLYVLLLSTKYGASMIIDFSLILVLIDVSVRFATGCSLHDWIKDNCPQCHEKGWERQATIL